MAEKSTESTTLIVKVDLDCPRCYKKISDVLCKLQASAYRERIGTVSYDGKKQTISISGPFDPILLGGKLRSMAGTAIKDIQIKPPTPPTPPTPPPCTFNWDIMHLELKVADLQRKQQICVDKNRDIDQMKPRVADLERQQRMQLKWDMAKLKEQEQICARQTGHDGRSCHCQPTVHIPPCYSGRYDGVVGCSCDKVHGGTVRPMLVGCHGGAPYCGCYRGCQFVSEEDSSTGCCVM